MSTNALQFVLPRGPRYTRPMRDRFFFPIMALIVIGMIALALVWPQGLGRPASEMLGWLK